MPIEFANAVHKAAYEKLSTMLKDEFGRQAWAAPDAPLFWLTRGSAQIQVYVRPASDTATVIRSSAWVVTGAENTPELHKFLLEENLTMRFGAFSIDNVGDICFAHAIHGESATLDSLLFSLYAVANTADEYDDKIVQRFGGQRAVDRKSS